MTARVVRGMRPARHRLRIRKRGFRRGDRIAPRATGARGELEAILRELYMVLVRHRRRLKLVDRCAHDHPELAALWFKGGRELLLGLLAQYLELRGKRLRALPDRAVAARIVIENLVLWAVHRPPSARPPSGWSALPCSRRIARP